MRRILTACICVAILALPGCKGCREERARYGSMLKTKPAPRNQAPAPSELNFRGLDLTTAPRTTRSSDLPDLWEERPKGSRSYEIRKDVICSYMGLDGTVYYVPGKKHFYVQKDPLESSTLTFYGPFDGDPQEALNLSESDMRPIHAEQPGGE